ncbi:MAG: flagellin [SAR324 cluster bacterium]|jgi:flagellin|nr:flagellin [SAR324 cluster bacterium]HJL87998.1 flagellin [SAR324 cluster bacterium]|tara:strand:- start:2724 stop:4187 length:1464 start_codon:yes stop_codon:yes gene_type:complete
MTIRINTNASALNTHRNVVNNSRAQAKNLEKLSSGLKINRAADAPAALNASEQLRAQTASLKQAIDNTEMSVSLMQTAEAALDEVSRALISARQLAVHAANTGTNDEFMHTADQQEIESILSEINTIAANTQYGKNFLLDGSRAGNGITTGKNIEFLDADHRATSSGAGGHKITISQASTRSEVTGTVALSQQVIEQGEQITITEGGRTVNFKSITNANVEQNMNELALAIEEAGLNLELVRPDTGGSDGFTPQLLTLRHKNYGSEHSFQVTTNTAGLISNQSDVPDWIQNGVDVKGEIAGEESTGRGQVLTGGPGAGVAEGIRIRYNGEKAPEGQTAGTVTFMQNSLEFHIGHNINHRTKVSFNSVKVATLGTGMQNDSGFSSLADINLMDGQKAMDSMTVIDRAIEEVAATRGRMGAFQKNTLESNLNFLRIAHENTLSSESVVRDADMATEMANFTRNQILMESSVAMLAQANAQPLAMLKLLQ